jgi:2-polyprenyl-3-methyl-5-hydroxy-6-metoxy-1,4-benzoquinol methylase
MNLTRDDYKFKAPRTALLQLLPVGCERALDVGCSVGVTGEWLKKNHGVSEVVGLEINESAAREAEKILDRVITGDVETLKLDYPAGYFDLIIYADVLEHLRDPWGYVKKQSALLKDGGYVLASLPNAANWRVTADLLRNKWEYRDYGIMDRTHLRFFTLPGMVRMFKDAGYSILKTEYNRGRMSNMISAATFGALSHLVTFQYYFLLRKTS